MAAVFQIIDANTTIGAHPDHRLDMSIERLISEMDANKIAGCLAQPTLGIYDSHDRGNAAIIEAVRGNTRLAPVATVNPLRYFGRDEDMQKICALGFRMFRFRPVEQGWAIDSAAFAHVLKQLASANMPFMVDAAHSGGPSAVVRAAAGYTAPVILSSVSLETLSEALAVMADNSNFLIETHELHVPGALEMIAARVGSDRIVFGSGAPLRSTASSLNYITYSELPDEDKQRVLGGNIRRVLEAK